MEVAPGAPDLSASLSIVCLLAGAEPVPGVVVSTYKGVVIGHATCAFTPCVCFCHRIHATPLTAPVA